MKAGIDGSKAWCICPFRHFPFGMISRAVTTGPCLRWIFKALIYFSKKVSSRDHSWGKSNPAVAIPSMPNPSATSCHPLACRLAPTLIVLMAWNNKGDGLSKNLKKKKKFRGCNTNVTWNNESKHSQLKDIFEPHPQAELLLPCPGWIDAPWFSLIKRGYVPLNTPWLLQYWYEIIQLSHTLSQR